VSRVCRSQAHSSYRPLPVNRLLKECNRRVPSQGPRCFEMLVALVKRFPQVQSGTLYIGDEGIAKLMGEGRCGKTAHRAKYDLLRVGLIRLKHAGPRMCPCGRCGGEKAGGTILNSNGKAVAAATGYEVDPALFGQPKSPKPPRPSSSYESPAQRRLREQNQDRMKRALESLRPRAGP
jgi:hypothetical protein